MPCQRAQPSWLPPRSPSPVGAPYVRSRDFEFFSEPGSNMGWRLWWGCFGATTRANTGYLSERGSGVLVSVNISMHPFQQESRCSSHSTKSHSSLFQGLRESGLVVGPVHKGMPPTQSTQRKVCQPFNCRDDVWWEPQAVSKWVENTMTVQISNPIQIQIQIQFKFKFSSNPIQIQIQIQFKFKFKFSSHSYSNPIQIQIQIQFTFIFKSNSNSNPVPISVIISMYPKVVQPSLDIAHHCSAVPPRPSTGLDFTWSWSSQGQAAHDLFMGQAAWGWVTVS